MKTLVQISVEKETEKAVNVKLWYYNDCNWEWNYAWLPKSQIKILGMYQGYAFAYLPEWLLKSIIKKWLELDINYTTKELLSFSLKEDRGIADLFDYGENQNIDVEIFISKLK